MPALQHKLLRTIRTTLGQFLALVLIVLAGVCAYYGMNTAVIRLVAAQEQYYRETAFADYYFDVVRAPAGIVNQIQQLPGVVAVSGRIQKDVKVVRTEGVFDTGRLTSYAPQTAINRLQLTGGRFFDFNPSGGEAEIMIDPQYARAWKLKTGDPLKVIIEGRQLTFRITGTARSAEFMFKTKNPLEFPDFDNMAIIMIPQQQARQVLGMPGQINQILITASPGAEQSGLKEAVNKILQPYGVTGSYPRADQSGHKYVQSQVDTLVLAARLMPPGFFLVAMVMQFVLLRRLIKSQRLQIGVMKALGYKNSAIMAMYTEYSLAVTTAGILSGCLAGSGLARMVAGLFGQLLELPVTTGGINWPVFFYVVMVTTGVGLASGVLASWEITRINPAEAFHAELPATCEKSLVEQWSGLWQNTNSSWKMSLRSISRNRTRFAAVIMGIAVTAGMILVAIYFTGSRDFLLTRYFEREHTYDCVARFDNLIKRTSVNSWSGWNEIKKMEPVLELPVVMKCPGTEGLYGKKKEELLIGIERSTQLRQVLDDKEQRIFIPAEGIVISSRIAKSLGLKVGDQVVVETKPGYGPVHSYSLLVRGINRQNIGASSFASLEQVNSILGGQGLINAVMIESAPQSIDALEKRLIDLPGVDSVMRQDKQQKNAVILLSGITYFTVIMIILAVLIGAAIVYNNSIMAFNERRRELASLRVIGWSNENIASMLFNEIILAIVLGVAIGLPAGKYIGGLYLQAISNETFNWPIVSYPSSYIISLLTTAGFAMAGHMLALRRVRELDLVEVLKDRE